MRAILSVYDKTGVLDFARGLEGLGFELFSTGGTEGLLRESGVAVRGVQELTGFPEMLGGRVKTLHPAVHGGILALRDDPGHLEELARQGLQPIDVVVANLYPFLEVARQAAARMSVALENIDVGGHTLLRAAAKNFAHAYRRALATDPQTAFGSAVAANRVVDEEAAHEIAAVFFEDLVAPAYTREALAVLKNKQDLRLFATQADQGTRGVNGSSPMPGELDYKRVLGGFLVQTRDALPEQSFTPRVVTQRQPNLDELTSLLFAWRAVKHSTSNAVMLVKDRSLVSFGVGQPSRLDAVDLACRKAGERAQGSVLASDGFFPFADAIERAADAGVTAVIQPGGSSRDAELIRLANRSGMAMIFTSERHYRH